MKNAQYWLDLQLFATVTQTTTLNGSGNDLSPEMKTYYEKRLLDNAEPNLVHDQFADKYPIRKMGAKLSNSANTVPWPRRPQPSRKG